MKFCSECGSAEVVRRIPVGDTHIRHVCERLWNDPLSESENRGRLHSTLARKNPEILLCRRSIEPRYGYWTLPAGFMETGESTQQAAAREAWEEAQAVVENLTLYAIYSLTHISQVYMMFRAELREGKASVGAESLEVALFAEEEIPWRDLAFPVVDETLKRYFEERRSGRYNLHMGDISREPDGKVIIRRY